MCIEPSWVQRQTSSVANGITGASRRSITSSAVRSAEIALRVAGVGALLDELEVVVAERPEELLGHLERAGVVVLLVRRGRGVDHDAELGEHVGVELGITGSTSRCAAVRSSAGSNP